MMKFLAMAAMGRCQRTGHGHLRVRVLMLVLGWWLRYAWLMLSGERATVAVRPRHLGSASETAQRACVRVLT